MTARTRRSPGFGSPGSDKATITTPVTDQDSDRGPTGADSGVSRDIDIASIERAQGSGDWYGYRADLRHAGFGSVVEDQERVTELWQATSLHRRLMSDIDNEVSEGEETAHFYFPSSVTFQRWMEQR